VTAPATPKCGFWNFQFHGMLDEKQYLNHFRIILPITDENRKIMKSDFASRLTTNLHGISRRKLNFVSQSHHCPTHKSFSYWKALHFFW